MNSQIGFQKFLQKSAHLPTLPGVAMKILAAAGKEDPDIREIAEIVSYDPSLSSKILKTVNSAVYGAPTEIVSISHAIRYLGLSAIKNLFIGFSIIENIQIRKAKYFDYTNFWKESLIGATSARLITEIVNKQHGESAFLLGLLQNIGVLILVETFPVLYEHVIDESESAENSLYETESRVLSVNHMDVGQHVISSWGLPLSFSKPIGHHHQPDKIAEDDSDIELLTRILHLSAICINIFSGNQKEKFNSQLKNCIEKYGFSNLINSETIIRETLFRVDEIFSIFELSVTDEDYLWLLKETYRVSKLLLET